MRSKRNIRKRARVHGFRNTSDSVLRRRRSKGRKSLAPQHA